MDPTLIIKNISDIAPYSGEHALPGIRFRPARQALGVTAWGMNVLELDPHNIHYPEHDHKAEGQEELYVVLCGSAVLLCGDNEHQVKVGDMVRIGPSTTRKFVTRDQGVTLLAIGATPGKAYEVSRT